MRAIESVLTDVRKAVTKLAQNKARDDAQQQMRRPWHMLTAEQAEQRWLELRAWVDWFVVRNNIGPKEIPDCWYLHGGLVDELEALRWAWMETNKPESKGTDPIWWREALHRARTRWPLVQPERVRAPRTPKPGPRVMAGEREWNELPRRGVGRPAGRSAGAGELVPARPVVDERQERRRRPATSGSRGRGNA